MKGEREREREKARKRKARKTATTMMQEKESGKRAEGVSKGKCQEDTSARVAQDRLIRRPTAQTSAACVRVSVCLLPFDTQNLSFSLMACITCPLMTYLPESRFGHIRGSAGHHP